MQKKTYNQPIGKIGTVAIDLPVIELGAGTPIVTISSAIHGDELTGIFILQKLVDIITLTKGTLRIIPVLNPLGFAEKKRINPIDGADLNRSFGVSAAKLRFSHYIAETMKRFVADSELIIDLHVFGVRRSLTTAIQYHGDNETLNQKNLRYIKMMNPDFIWQENIKTGEIDKTGMLIGYAYDLGKTSFGMEYTIHFDVNEKEIDRNVSGLVNILNSLAMTEQKFPAPERKIPIIERISQINDEAGLFIPHKKLGENIKKGDIVGQLLDPATLEMKDIAAEKEGVLFSIADRELMNTAEKMFTLAKKINEL